MEHQRWHLQKNSCRNKSFRICFFKLSQMSNRNRNRRHLFDVRMSSVHSSLCVTRKFILIDFTIIRSKYYSNISKKKIFKMFLRNWFRHFIPSIFLIFARRWNARLYPQIFLFPFSPSHLIFAYNASFVVTDETQTRKRNKPGNATCNVSAF